MAIDQAHETAPPAAAATSAGRALRYVLPAALAAAVLLVQARVWQWPAAGILPGGSDMTWAQSMAQVHQQTGPWGTTPHLGWPAGFSAWSHPQLGLMFATVTWLSGLIGLGSAVAAYLALVAAAAMNAASTTFLLRSVAGERQGWAVAAVSLVAGASPFVTTKLPHSNVAAFYAIGLVLGLALRLAGGPRPATRAAVAAVVLGVCLSPAWWSVVAIALLAVCVVAGAVARRWALARAAGLAALAALPGLLLGYALAIRYAQPTGSPTRNAWDSNSHGGHLVDLIRTSPWLNRLWELDDAIWDGASLEVQMPGLVLGALAALAVVAVVTLFPGRLAAGDPTYLLRTLTLAALLFFLLGGFGNLQAGLAVLAGGQSPARAWSRMILVLALLGAAWMLIIAARWHIRRPVAVVAAAAAVWVTWMDVAAAMLPYPLPVQTYPEYEVVSFLRAHRPPCPVAQLPQEDFPIPRATPLGPVEHYERYLYRGFIPYLIAPEFYWSYTSWYPGARNGLDQIALMLTDSSLDRLAGAGFCAVLFDKDQAAATASINGMIEGRDLATTTPADYDSERYALFLLTPGSAVPELGSSSSSSPA